MEPSTTNPEQSPSQRTSSQPQKPSYERPQEDGMHPMVVLQPGERVVATVKRHPFGIVSMYLGGVLGLAVAGILAFVLLPHVVDQYNAGGTAMNFVYAGLGVFAIGLIGILGAATAVYWQNEWVITTDSITQISQRSLFGRQVAQLSMDNLEDVTVDQDGVMPHIFNFGTLRVETAGERSKFQFPYCPNPNEYARQILEVHEQFLEERRNIQHHP